MGYSSEQWIDEHNERLATDEQYAADYEESMRIDAALEAHYFAQERENEKYVDWFDDSPIDHSGQIIELPEPAVIFIDEDIPF